MASTTDASITALLTEHFTYRPIALVDDVINSINILSYRATAAVEKGLLTAPPSSLGIKSSSSSSASTSNPETQELQHSEQIKHEIENGVHQLETLLESKIDKNFDKFEIYVMRNVLTVDNEIRDWVRLEHYNGLEFPSSASESEQAKDKGPTADSVKDQRLRLRELMKLRTLLSQEKKENEATINGLLALLGQPLPRQTETKLEPGTESQENANTSAFGFLQERGTLKGDVEKPVTTSTSFAISQLPAQRSLLEDFQSRLDSLQQGNGGEGMFGEEEKGFRRERGEFVETQTKKHLENVRGLELGEMGEVRDGDWQGEGGRIAKGDVEGLERIVGILGNGKDHAKSSKDGDGEPMDES